MECCCQRMGRYFPRRRPATLIIWHRHAIRRKLQLPAAPDMTRCIRSQGFGARLSIDFQQIFLVLYHPGATNLRSLFSIGLLSFPPCIYILSLSLIYLLLSVPISFSVFRTILLIHGNAFHEAISQTILYFSISGVLCLYLSFSSPCSLLFCAHHLLHFSFLWILYEYKFSLFGYIHSCLNRYALRILIHIHVYIIHMHIYMYTFYACTYIMEQCILHSRSLSINAFFFLFLLLPMSLYFTLSLACSSRFDHSSSSPINSSASV